MTAWRLTRRRMLAAGASALLAGGVQARRRRKNVLFMAIDDLNMTLGCYGDATIRTPHLDALAKQGMRFDRAYCQFPVCNPSRTSLLTGLRPDSTGILDNRVPFRSRLPNVVTLPQLFRQSGYFTARLGKIFHSAKGMDDPKGWDVTFDPSATELGKTGEGRNLTGGKVGWCRWLAANGSDEDQPDGQLAARAIRLLAEDRDKPFFIGLGFHKPHDPFIAPKRYFDLYPIEKLEPPRLPENRSGLLPLAIASEWKESFDKFTDIERREFMRAYYAGTSFVDTQVGKVLAALERYELLEDTVILFFSDHGYHLGAHGWWNKNTLYEHSCRVPLLMAAPGEAQQGAHCNRFVELVDLYPTLADVCGLKPPNTLEGRSFRPLLSQPDQEWKEAVFTQVKRGAVAGRTVRTKWWRYIEWDQGHQGTELYDHEKDPGEYHNLGGDPRYEGVRNELRTLLHSARQA